KDHHRTVKRAAIIVAAILFASSALARNPEQPETAPKAGSDETFLDHSGNQPYWFGAEFNSILQFHPGFDAPYAGPNSLQRFGETAWSGLITVFGAYRPTRTTELILDVETALGGGISEALGLAGYTNYDVVRNPTLGPTPYIARAQIHQV